MTKLAAVVAVVAMTLFQSPDSVMVDGDPMIRVLGKDAIPAIDEPVFVSAKEADFMSDEELVIGVFDGGQAKAYSTWLLDSHEIVNDKIGSAAIAVTW